MFSLISAALAMHLGLIKIAIIDSGLELQDARFTAHLCKEGHKDFTGEGIEDTDGHGTAIAGLIQQYAGSYGYCFVIVKYFSNNVTGHVNLEREVEALEYIEALEPNFVNLSSGGPEINVWEKNAIRKMNNTLFIVAAGNDGKDLDSPDYGYFPASYNLPNIIAVGSSSTTSNYGNKVVREPGENILILAPKFTCKKQGWETCTSVESGTSFSAAIHTGKLVRRLIDVKNSNIK